MLSLWLFTHRSEGGVFAESLNEFSEQNWGLNNYIVDSQSLASYGNIIVYNFH